MCPTSLVYKKDPSRKRWLPLNIPCIGNAALPKVLGSPFNFTHIYYGERGIFGSQSSGDCPIPKPYQQGSCGRGYIFMP